MPDRRRKGRAEVGLDNQLRELTTAQVPPGPRAGLRVLARGLDLAEASGDPDLIATAGNAYFHALDLNGLTPAEVAPVDSFADLLAELGRAGAGASDSPQPRP